jgi:Putative beta-barrel porin 2
MSGSRFSMLKKGSILLRCFARLAFVGLFLNAWIPPCLAQAPSLTDQAPSLVQMPSLPPLDILANRLPARDPNAITVDGWLLYPTLRVYSPNSDNLFLSPQSPISSPGFGVTPSLAAVWSNGIHTTTLYGNIDRQVYPNDNDVNTLDGRAGFVQRYEAMRDLIFSFNGNYAHQTWASGLQNSIQTPSAAPTTALLSNGNTVLPNGTILSPSGQPIGQVSALSGSTIPLVVNPSNQYTGTFSVDKIFNRGILSLSGSVNRTDFENQNQQPSSNSRTLTEHLAFWLGPLFYVYSNGSVGTVVTDTTSISQSTSTTSYRVIGGIGTRQFGLFRGSVYFGHQGSDISDQTAQGGGSTAGGAVYGGALSYYPTADWTLIGTIDRTINISSSQASPTNLALTVPGLTAVQVPLTASTQITSTALQSSYQITPQWFANCLFAYAQIEYIGSPRVDNSYVFDMLLRYNIWQNMSLTWEYRYTSVLSNAPLASATSNSAIVGTTYRF